MKLDFQQHLSFFTFLSQKMNDIAAQIQQASAKLRNVFVKALLWC